MQVPGKTAGTGIGAAGAALYAPDLTALTLYWTGWDLMPPHVLPHVQSVTLGFWSGVMLVGGLYAGHLWNKLLARWSPPPSASA